VHADRIQERLARLLETTLTALGLISAQIGSVFADFNKLKAQTIRLVEEHSARLEEYDYDEQGITDKKSAEVSLPTHDKSEIVSHDPAIS
jgi:hypothetical protein